MSAISLSHLNGVDAGASGFVSLLPAIANHARMRFGRLRPEAKAEAIAETIAAAYQNYTRLRDRNQLDRAFVSTLADFASRHVAQERHVGTRESSRDLLSPLARKRRGFALSSLPDEAEGSAASWRLLASQNARVSPADQAIFRLDFQVWLRSCSRRERKIIHCLASGEGTLAAAGRFGLTPGRISQLRRRFERSWSSYQGQVQ